MKGYQPNKKPYNLNPPNRKPAYNPNKEIIVKVVITNE